MPTPEQAPSVEELRQYLDMIGTPLSCGWPSVDAATGGLLRGDLVVIQAPVRLRQTFLARMSAWVAGEGYAVVHATARMGDYQLWQRLIEAGSTRGFHELAHSPTISIHLERTLRDLRLSVVGAGSRTGRRLRTAVEDMRPLDLLLLDDWALARDDYPAAVRGEDSEEGRARLLLGHLKRFAQAWGAAVIVADDSRHGRDGLAATDDSDLRLTLDSSCTDTDAGAVLMVTSQGHSREVRMELEPDGGLQLPRNTRTELIRRAGHTNHWRALELSDVVSPA